MVEKIEEIKILDLIYSSIDNINELLSDDMKLSKDRKTPLYGEQGSLDSISLINLIVAVEESIEEELGESITLANEKAMSLEQSPFRNVGPLCDYIISILKENGIR